MDMRQRMIDPIDRQEAINAIENTDCELSSDAWDELTAAIMSLPSAQRWIPVTERLPEANGRYLVTRGFKGCDAMWNRVYIINYSDLMGLKSERIWWNGNVGKSDFVRVDGVKAWMPLPEPYREEEEDATDLR